MDYLDSKFPLSKFTENQIPDNRNVGQRCKNNEFSWHLAVLRYNKVLIPGSQRNLYYKISMQLTHTGRKASPIKVHLQRNYKS